jgi:hypothetical protein
MLKEFFPVDPGLGKYFCLAPPPCVIPKANQNPHDTQLEGEFREIKIPN